MYLAQDQIGPVSSASLPTMSSSDAQKLSSGENKPTDAALSPVKSNARTYPWFEKDSVYGVQHELQNYDICLPRPLEESSKEDTVWIIFIHGGAWRDPSQDKSELDPALSQFFPQEQQEEGESQSSSTLKHIAGFVSINYGLSAYPPDDESQPVSLRVQHNRHILDVVVALSYLEKKYDIGTASGYRYVLVGHSAGATLAFQSITHQCPCATYLPARAIVGLAGIYDLPLLVDNHADVPFYRKIVTNAFREDEEVWKDVSPANGVFTAARGKGGLETVILGAADGDVLVEKQQWEVMQQTLEKQGWKMVGDDDDRNENGAADDNETKEIVLLSLKGKHDEIWKLGEGVRKSIELVIARLFPASKQ